MNALTDLAARLSNPAPFFRAKLTQLGERMVAELRDNTPGERLPQEWRYEIEATADAMALRVFHQRLEGDRETWENIFHYLNRGTRTHYVMPTQAQALHWVENGTHYFSKGHVVSGILGAFFAEKADRLVAEFERTFFAEFQTWVTTGRL